MLWKWMLLNGWDHPSSLWNGLRTSFCIGWGHSLDGMRPPCELDETIIMHYMRPSFWNGWGHPLEWMWSSFRINDTILVKWEYPCEMDENILLNGRKTSHPWSLDLWCLDETSLSWQRMDGWASLSSMYSDFWHPV
jgi:hypothetical protein